eukprot:GILI01022438.1.p1 GENE.GILI01022438.1~~GILI01022438.1.p1  ORF type:complete len:115 (+),score=42.46 GILI01022438.1:52-345(+)
MPVTTPIAMRKRGELMDKRIGTTAANAFKKSSDDEESSSPSIKAKRGSAALTKKGRRAEKTGFQGYLVYIILFAMVGGIFVQMITNIWTQPSMSESH